MFVFFGVIRGREFEDLDGWADSTMRFAGSEKIECRMSNGGMLMLGANVHGWL